MGRFFEELKEGLEEALDHEKGKKPLRSRLVELPELPPRYTAKEIKRIRGNYSQKVFALILNVSLKTVQSWESGRTSPRHAALRLLEILDKKLYRPNC